MSAPIITRPLCFPFVVLKQHERPTNARVSLKLQRVVPLQSLLFHFFAPVTRRPALTTVACSRSF